jgi:hypothetical protein
VSAAQSQPLAEFWRAVAEWIAGNFAFCSHPNTSECKDVSEFNVDRMNAVTGEGLQLCIAAEAHKRLGDKDLPLITRQRSSKRPVAD